MKVIRIPHEMQAVADEIRSSGQTIGFVPTMGYLHEGHLSLLRLANKNCDRLVASIFVNPTQFAPDEDFNLYPRNFEQDKQLCEQENVEFLLYPGTETLYSPGYQTYVITDTLSQEMCGISRPTHFRGVTTVVCKLLHIVKPNIAVFGQKDAQQALIIRRMVEDLNIDVKIITCSIVRENDGLAMSSRNKYLSSQERSAATYLSKSLDAARILIQQGELHAHIIQSRIESILNQTQLLELEYIAIVEYENLKPVSIIDNNTLIALAVQIGKTRLIDNILVQKINPTLIS
jgi:pantoate--beta-alanine ligase